MLTAASVAAALQAVTSQLHAEHGADVACQHPATIAIVDKLASLARVQDVGRPRIMDAHLACLRITDGEPVDWVIQ